MTSQFDGPTEEVVKRFQVQAGLRPDGIVGPDTWAALDSVMGGTALTEPEQKRLETMLTDGGSLVGQGDFEGALAKFMALYADPAMAHKALGGLVYNIALCHHRLLHWAEAISFYEQVMATPGVGARLGGAAAENLRRARLQQPYQDIKQMEEERAAFAG